MSHRHHHGVHKALLVMALIPVVLVMLAVRGIDTLTAGTASAARALQSAAQHESCAKVRAPVVHPRKEWRI
jgi:hypothetical protein